MALWELIFVLGMTGLQLVYLVNRRRRWPVLNYLIFLLGGIGALSLIFEGWRWQTLLVFILWLWQGFYLMLTLRTLQEGFRVPKGFFSLIGSLFRTLCVTASLFLCLVSLVVALLFPLADLRPTGLWSVSTQILESAAPQARILLFYPTKEPSVPFNGHELAAGLRLKNQVSYSVPSGFFDYQDRVVRGLSYAAPLPEGGGTWPVVYFFPGSLESSWEWSMNLAELASRGYVVAAWIQDPLVWENGPPPGQGKPLPWDFLIQPEAYKTRTFPLENLESQIRSAKAVLDRLALQTPWKGRLELNRPGLLVAGNATNSLAKLPKNTQEFVAWAAWGSTSLKESWNPSVPGLEVPIGLEDRTSLESPPGIYTLIMPKITRADLTDQGLLSPYLYPLGWRSRVDGRSGYLTARVTVSFFDWQMGRGDGSLFLYGKPDLNDVLLNRPR